MPSPEILADFVDRFTAYWKAPDPDVLPSILSEDVRLVAPLTATTDGLADGMEGFRDLLAGIPDLTGEVHRWGPHGEGVFIEFTLRGTLGDRQLELPAVDVFLVGDDGLATQRVSYFDPGPLLAG